MEYNTQRDQLKLPEYGRNIQQMINQLLEVEDREARNKMAKAIIFVMGNMNPHLRDVNDFKHKLWDHLHIMSDFKLDIDSPYPKPDINTIFEKPKIVPYPTNPIAYKHYGRSIELMIGKAIEMENADEKEALTELIANHMKRSFLTWNKDSVTDEDIIRDLTEMSNGQLTLAPDFKLNEVREAPPHKSKKKFSQRKNK